jgi:CheY-like chemotaxis protein
VLVVEDSFIVGQDIARQLAALGAEVVAIAATVEQAMRVLDEHGCTGAVLDINLGEETSESVAWRLSEEKIPFFFISGYAEPRTLLQHVRFRANRLLSKPVDSALLAEAVEQEFGGEPFRGAEGS